MTEVTTFRCSYMRVFLVAVGTFFASVLFVMAVAFTAGTNNAFIIIPTGLAATLPGLWFVQRGLVMGVTSDATGIVHRGSDRTRTFPWCKIRSIDLGPASGHSPLPNGTAVLTLDDGAVRPLDGMAELLFTDAARARMNARCDLLRELHADHKNACPTC